MTSIILKFVRVFKILRVAIRYGLDDIAMSGLAIPRTTKLLNQILFWRDLSEPRGVRLRRALEDLGPIFVKFGQVLSTRRDLMPMDIADELARLQDRVPPFSSELAIAQIIKSLGAHPDVLFAEFEVEPVASASIAQVHFARLKNGKDVAVKLGEERFTAKLGKTGGGNPENGTIVAGSGRAASAAISSAVIANDSGKIAIAY